MYYERLPAYLYELPCGHAFRSLTPSEPVNGCAHEPETGPTTDAAHWFYCRTCKAFQVVEPADLVEHRPARYPGNQAKVVDAAIKLDRIRAYYLVNWDALDLDAVAEEFGASKTTVFRVASELGVYDY